MTGTWGPGETGDAIVPVNVHQGQLHKFRFINASTAAGHTPRVTRGQFRVTHTDTLVLQPGERLDVEYAATGGPGAERIESADRDLGLSIPLVYGQGSQTPVASPFVPPPARAYAGIVAKKPDFTLVLNSQMGSHGGGRGAMMDHGSGTMPMEWTINGQAFPDTTPLKVRVGQVVKVRFVNNDTQMMHAMDHPIHLHGTFFQVVSINGRAPERETWKDTLAVPAGGSVEVAFRFQNPGDWMLHDHEDNGMMTVVQVAP